MDSVVIVAPHDYGAELKLRLGRDWAVTQGAGEAWVVEADASRVYLSHDVTSPARACS
jgi:hypothetical protein